jgi:uncharacterized protein YbbK (DUF523 family)
VRVSLFSEIERIVPKPAAARYSISLLVNKPPSEWIGGMKDERMKEDVRNGEGRTSVNIRN